MKLELEVVVILTIVAISSQSIEAVKFDVCDTTKSLAEVKSVKVSECDSSIDPCPFIRGFNKSIELDFIPKQQIEQVKVKIAGKLSTLPVPFRVHPDIACGNYGFNCPLKAGEQYKFSLSLPVLRTYPKLKVEVFLRLVDEKGDTITCIELPARIEEPQKQI